MRLRQILVLTSVLIFFYALYLLLFAKQYSRVPRDSTIIQDDKKQADFFNNQGASSKDNGEYLQALNYYFKALEMYQKSGDKEGIATVTHNIAEVYRHLGEYITALEYYQRALSYFESPENINLQKLSASLHGMGLIYYQLGQYDKSLDYYQQALAFRQKLQEKEQPKEELLQLKKQTGETLNNIGLVYAELENHKSAIEYYQQAINTYENIDKHDIDTNYATILNNLSLSYTELNQHEQALETITKALEIATKLDNKLDLANFSDTLGTVYRNMGKYNEALAQYQQSLITIQSVGEKPLEIAVLNNIAKLFQQQNRTSLAIIFYKEAVNLTEEIRIELTSLTIDEQKQFTSTIEENYRNLADLLLSQGRILEAQQVLELLKIQEISNYTRSGKVSGDKQQTIATNEQETEVLNTHGTLIALGKKISDCETNNCDDNTYNQLLDDQEIISQEFQEVVNQLEEKIKQSQANDTAFLDPNKITATSAKIVEAQPDTVLIYPLILEDKIWILWASSGGITSSIEVDNVSKKELSKTVLKFRELLQSATTNLTELNSTAKKLYDWLIPQQLAEELTQNKIKNLVFSLDSVTRYIPIEVLFDGENYLLNNYTISTIISAELTDLDERLPSSPSILAGGLSIAVAGFNPLPNVELELDNIVINSPEDKIGVYQGSTLLNQEFHRKSIRNNLRNHNILHIATHGKFVPGDNKKSYLMLGDGEKYPIPEIEKLRGLDKIHLVVLSACETALGGEGNDGTEIAGISYYFLNQGVDTVIASLWQVDDESTSLLMQYFYQNLDSGMSKAEALRQAKLSLING